VTVTAYWRPATLAEALELLERPTATVLAGGTRLNTLASEQTREVVDLQAIGLDGFDTGPGDTVRVGAMASLQQLVDSDLPGIIREAARRELPSTLRSQATLGGCIVTGESESELLAALLVHEASVELASRRGAESVPLEALLDRLPLPLGDVVVALTVVTSGESAAARTARTPADRPIVAACARATADGLRVAVAGVGQTPVLHVPGAALHPRDDFRGNGDYRRALADVLVARVVKEVS